MAALRARPWPTAATAGGSWRPRDTARGQHRGPGRPGQPGDRSVPDGEGPGDIGELMSSVQLSGQAGARGAVRQIDLDLGDA